MQGCYVWQCRVLAVMESMHACVLRLPLPSLYLFDFYEIFIYDANYMYMYTFIIIWAYLECLTIPSSLQHLPIHNDRFKGGICAALKQLLTRCYRLHSVETNAPLAPNK